ncbi:MAG: phosphoribosylformylglycinamidine synthase subunit PurQ [Proteobacteria bacterium]|nr:phosphoribosylformylglycinamidine synthase subunit PurQ [Pseudomonadota bacterium]
MKSAVIVYPGSNCDRDMQVALKKITGSEPLMVWHGDSDFEKVDLIAIPGGFAYGDYLRSGAIAARSPVMREVVRRAHQGVFVLGVCNGFQIVAEAGLLPGALMRNRDLKFLCKDVYLRVENAKTAFTSHYAGGQVIRVPVAHFDGNYFASDDELKALEDGGQVVFRYCTGDGELTSETNVNGSMHSIAGIINKPGNVLGMMPHPERLIEDILGGSDGRALFKSLLETFPLAA